MRNKRELNPALLCKRCHQRYAQERGRCRRCNRERGDTRRVIEIEAAQLARLFARYDAPRPAPVPPGHRRTVTIDGIEYEVMFDGT
jgi:hypothetical protein